MISTFIIEENTSTMACKDADIHIIKLSIVCHFHTISRDTSEL